MVKAKLGEILTKNMLVRDVDVAHALAVQAQPGPRRRIGQVLVDLGLVTDDVIAKALAAQLDLPWVDVLAQPIDPPLLWKIPRKVAEMHDLFAFGRDETGAVKIALADPLSDAALRDVELLLGKRARVFVSSSTKIQKAIARHYDLEPHARRMLEGVANEARMPTTSPTALELDAQAIRSELQKSGPAAYVSLLNFLIVNAIERLASDIHMDPEPDGLRIRFRIDGMLREVLHLPPWANGPLVTRVKVVARMDVADHRRPQDGKASAHLGARTVDLRVSTMPSQFGESVVVRILDDRAARVDLAELGMGARALADYFGLIAQPQGMLLVVGPTGSGKTTTLYATINRLKSETISICTLEDPIEQTIAGVKQVQIDEKSSLTFAEAIRSLLRQDPNVLVIGEIRDQESAAAAVDAATTGHLVLSTMHTRQTIDSVLRLLDLGVPPYLVGNALSGVVAQRLIRRACEICSIRQAPSAADWERLGIAPIDLGPNARVVGPGCPTCQYAGYVGRVAIFEVLRMDDGLRALVLGGASEQVLFQHATSAGLVTLLDDAIDKVRRGVTTLEEVARVVPIERWRTRPPLGSAPPVAFAPTDPLPPPSATGVSPAHASSGKPVALVVDDSDEILRLVGAALEDEYVVRLARDGLEALDSIAAVVPDVVVLDVMMPRMTGYELCARLRDDPHTEQIPVLMLSARGETPHVKEGLRAGADDYLPKPFDPEELVLRVNALLRRAGVLLRA